MEYNGLPLDPFQEEAIRAVDRDRSVLVAAPTGAGKTLIAEYAVEQCIRLNRRAVYTAPIKALSNQKFRDFTLRYGDRIGIKTGDVTINPDALIVLMTTEIFRNTIFESPHQLENVHYAIFDEIHFLDDIERGTVWEESIIFAPPHIRFLCLSATIPNLRQLARWIRSVRPEVPLVVVREEERPVPLVQKIFVPEIGERKITELGKMEQEGRGGSRGRGRHRKPRDDSWRGELISRLHQRDRLPAIFFAFNRRDCEDFASSVDFPLISHEERGAILEEFDRLCVQFGVEPDPTVRHLRTLVGAGIAYHHAGLLPTLKEVLERLFTTGRLKLLFATETFAVGINMPARSVVFNTLYKFDGRRLACLPTRAHHQMSGRAGRRGIDKVGYVTSVAEWPHLRAKEIERIIWGEIEPIRSQFNLSYATILTLYEHLGERILLACEKSFANFMSKKRRGNRATQDLKEQMRRKLRVLRALGYLHGEKLTRKGRFARTIYGYELQVTEFYFRGLFENLHEDELAVLFSAIVFESKKAAWYRKLPRGRFVNLIKKANRAINDLLYTEETLDIEDRSKDLDFKLGSAVLAWARGADFRDLDAHTNAADGDIVRFLRITIQLLRNTRFACDREDPFRSKLERASLLICRDVVDAERQLRLGVEFPQPEAPPEEEEEDGNDPDGENDPA